MRKKFTLLFASLLAFAGVAKADVTDLPEMSTEGDIKWYTISNTRSASGKYLYWTESGVKDSNTRTGASFFYVTGSADACYIHNYATDLLFSGDGAWTDAGVACKLSVSPLNTGLMIGFNNTYLNEQNFANGFTTWGDVNDDGSVFVFEEVTDFSAIIDVPAAKDAAIAELNNMATVSVIYSAAVTNAVNEINAVNPASNGLKDLNDAVEAINAIVVNYRNAAYQALDGKFFTIQTLTKDRSKGFMQMTTSNVVGTATAESPANIWQFVCNDNGTVKVYNPYINKYLCEPQDNSSEVAVTSDKANAGAYVLNINASAEVADAKVKLTSNGKSVHMAGGSTLVRWDNGGASEWQVVEITDFSDIIELYKAATIATLDQWGQLSVVFDADLVSSAKQAIDGISTTDFATFAAIDATLTDVTNAVANKKVFTFQATSTDNHRNGVWVAANTSTEKAIGAHEQDYNAIWSLRHAGGTSFYMYNVLNSVYMGAPGSNCPLTAEPVAAYSFEIVDAEKNMVEMKCNGQTIHASNHEDNKLLDYDFDEAASRWYISSVGIVSDVHDVLTALDALQTSYENNAFAADAEIGNALGQYQGNKEAAVAAINAGKVMLDKTLAEQVALNVADIEAATAAINATTLVINLPEAGKFYRFQGACEASLPNYYITGHTNADGGRIALTADADDSTIFYYADGKLKAYESGKYIGLSSTHWTFADSTNVEAIKPASTIIFAASPRKAGTYTIKSADRYMHYTVYQETVQVNRCEEDTDAEHDWYITEVIMDNDPTGISAITTNAETVIYDLLGRRVEKMEKGIYIVNGRKVLVK